MSRKVIFVASIVSVALAISLIFSLNYYVNLRIQNENAINNMRARALAVYGSEVFQVAYFLEKYVQTPDSDVRAQIESDIRQLQVEGDILQQGTSEALYYELYKTAFALEVFISFQLYLLKGTIMVNTTAVETIVTLLREIGNPFLSLNVLKDKDPLENLYNSDVDTVISKCRQVQKLAANQ